MEFNRLLSSVISSHGEPDISKNNKNFNILEKKLSISSKNYHLIKNEDEIDGWLKEAEENGEITIDTETTSLDPHLSLIHI